MYGQHQLLHGQNQFLEYTAHDIHIPQYEKVFMIIQTSMYTTKQNRIMTCLIHLTLKRCIAKHLLQHIHSLSLLIVHVK